MSVLEQHRKLIAEKQKLREERAVLVDRATALIKESNELRRHLELAGIDVSDPDKALNELEEQIQFALDKYDAELQEVKEKFKNFQKKIDSAAK